MPRDHDTRELKQGVIMRAGLSVLWVLLVPLLAGAQEWYQGEGVVTLANITPEQARAEALSIARSKALEAARLEFVGITTRLIQESSGGEFTDHFVQFTKSVTRGRITDEEILFDKIVLLSGSEGESPLYGWKVRLRAQIVPESSEPDPAFQVNIALDRQTYRAGEPMTITVKATKECWVTVFCLYGADSLQVILPNDYQSDNHIERMSTLTIPPPGAPWDMPVDLASEREQSDEALLVVALKDSVPFFRPGMGVRRGLYATNESLLAISRWLVEIPADRRTESLVQYKVVR